MRPVPKKRRFLYRLYRSLWTGLDWLYPPQCGGCRGQGQAWCAGCNSRLRLLEPPLCPHCGKPQPSSSLCKTCLAHPMAYTALGSWAVYADPLRSALHRLKYKRDISLGIIFAEKLAGCLENLGWKVDLVLPVPLGVARLRERGYNQSSLLAFPLALSVGLTYAPGALSRVRETHTQVDLNASQRKENVSGAFRARPNMVTGKKVLVIDDITTTGSTIEACALALFQAGADRVYGLTVARALLSG